MSASNSLSPSHHSGEVEEDNRQETISSNTALVQNFENVLSEPLPASAEKLTNIQIFDISSDKNYIATVNSDYEVHVYKIKNSFENYEKMPVFEIYNSTDKKPVVASSVYSQSPTNAAPIHKRDSSPFFSGIYVCLSISDDGRFVTLSVSTQEKSHTKVIIYTTDITFRTKNGLWIINQDDLKSTKEFVSARPVFSNEEFLLATNNGIHIFNLKFEKTSTIKLVNSLQAIKYRSLYSSASCDIIGDSIGDFEENNKKKRPGKPLYEIQSILAEGALAESTHFAKQKLILQMCESDIIRTWSIENDKLVSSFKNISPIDFLALSGDNHKYFASADMFQEMIKIYSSKTNSKLYEIAAFKNSTGEEPAENNFDLIELNMSFLFDNNYLFLCGYLIKRNKISDSKKETERLEAEQKAYIRFELWYIPAQRLVYQNDLILKPHLQRKSITSVVPCSNDSFSVNYIRVNDNNELENDYFKVSIRKETDDSIQEGNSNIGWKEWTSSRVFSENEDDWITSVFKNDICFMLDNPKPIWKRYKLDDENGIFILLFGLSMVQLWRLNSIDDTTLIFDSSELSIFKIEDDPDANKKYNNFISYNELIYIHCYGTSIESLYKSDNPAETGEAIMDKIEIKFNADGHLGRTLLCQKSPDSVSQINSNNKEYFYELFLPMEKIISTSSTTKSSEKEKNSQNADDSVSASHLSNNTKQPESDTAAEGDSSNTQETNHDKPQTEDTSNKRNNVGAEEDPPKDEIPKKKLKGAEFHYFESTINALYYFETEFMQNEVASMVYAIIEKAASLLNSLFNEYEDTNYFATESGSYSLYILAQSLFCHTFIERIILKEDKSGDKVKKMNKSASINLFDPFDQKNRLNNQNIFFKNIKKVNVLTALLERNQNLFFLFFHHILIDSRTRGIGNMTAVTDLLLHIQKEKRLDILLKCTEVMEYFPVPATHPIQESEVQDAFDSSFSAKTSNNVCPFILPEKLDREEYGIIKNRLNSYVPNGNSLIFITIWSILKRITSAFKEENYTKAYQEPVTLKEFYVSDRKILCIVPFPNFNLHRQQEERKSNMLASMISALKSSDSPFTQIASSRTFNNMFVESNVVIEVMTIYKWSTFASKRFILILFVHAVYYISFSVGISFAEEVFHYNPGNSISSAGHTITLSIMFFSWSILCIQEIRQFANNIPAYMVLYNFIDWTALVMPIASLILMLKNDEYLNDVTSITTLVLWIHGILRLRAINTFGTTLELIIQISLKTMPFIGVFCSVVIAFTHTFIVLLRQKGDPYFQEQYSGNLSSATSENGSSSQGVINFADTSSQNNFKNPFTAFSSVWFFIYGVWDPINNGDAGDDTMIMILSILFSFISCLIFFNMIIALMSGTIEEVKRRGKKNWIHHLAAVVSEIELFWCTSAERLNEVNNPTWIYYVADIEQYEEQEEKIKERYENYLQRYTQDRKNYPSFFEPY